MKPFRVLTTAALFGFSLALGVSSSWAGPVTLPDIPAGASDGLFFAGGTPAFLMEVADNSTSAEGSITLDVPTLAIGVLDLTEPGTGVVSDVITAGIDPKTGSPALFLASDPFTTSGSPLSATATLMETGGWQDITSYFFPTIPAGTAFAFSDVETPEPTTLALLGSGLLGLVMMRRRKLGRTTSPRA
jgi:hypothetical protein